MNDLLRFNPEPFETESEFAGAGLLSEGEGWGQEAEFSSMRRRGRGGGSSFATPGPHRPSPRRSATFRTGGGRRPAPGQNRPPYRHRHRQGRLGAFPVAVPGWPWPISDGEPGPGIAGEPEPGPGSGHVRWVQTCLNQALGSDLPADGIINPQTRHAIREFQERRGLPINGLVGPETERALADACTGEGSAAPAGAGAQAGEPTTSFGAELEFEAGLPRRIRAPSRTRVSPIATPAPALSFDSQAFRQRIVRIANQELARWGGGKTKETDPGLRPVLQDYWKTGTGNSFSSAQLGDPKFQNDHPWSAAFISWVMRTAGAGNAFKYSSAHATYTRWAKDNRMANAASPFKAYRISELAPQVGDLVCKSRAGSGATYDNIRPGMKTHCDIVTEVRPGHLVTVGGNVSNSVSQTLPKTDARGFLTDPAYFAVIRINGTQPAVPVAPPPAPPTPAAGSAPKLIKQESVPPATTLYVEIDLQIVDKSKLTAPLVTGIFIPDNYVPGAAADLVIYLHGFKAEAIRRQAIDQYWNSQRFPYGALREGVNAGGRNVILVAPTLGSRSEAGSLVKPGGLDAYIAQVLAALRAYGPHRQSGAAPTLGNLILACHSGGGWPMRQLAGGGDRALAQLRECWGYDCTYNTGDDVFWARWARARPNARVYIYYIAGSPTAPLAEGLRNRRVQNAIVQPSRDNRHNYVPITHWQERFQGAGFLAARSGGAVRPSGGPPIAPVLSDVSRMTKPQFIEFVGENARRAMAATGVPASVTVAQAILETGWGKHTIGDAKNLFGIKGRGPAGSVRAPTKEHLNGKWVSVNADFAKYDSFEQSITEHARFFLRNRRYARALQLKDDADAFAREIHKAGYATGPDYSTQLIALMRQYNLYRFDR